MAPSTNLAGVAVGADFQCPHWLDFVRNMVFFKLLLQQFSTILLALSPPHSFLLVSLFEDKAIRVLLISKDAAEHNVQLQRTTRFERYLRGLASG